MDPNDSNIIYVNVPVYVASFLAGGGVSEAGGPTGCGEVARGGRAYLLGNSV
jgi:hypothetical protein